MDEGEAALSDGGYVRVVTRRQGDVQNDREICELIEMGNRGDEDG